MRFSCSACLIFGWLLLAAQPAAAQSSSPLTPAEQEIWKTWTVDREHPVHSTEFDDPRELEHWTMEGGKRIAIEQGNLILENDRRGDLTSVPEGDHLVAWLKQECPADFLLEFTFRPELRTRGLCIVIFNTRGKNGESVFDPGLAKRTGFFAQYHSGDINNYHISYWAGDRKTANIRKNVGFHLVAEGADLITDAPADSFQTVRVFKRGGQIRLTVDDRFAVGWDDDGKTYGPVHTHTGWIALRQMSYAGKAWYGRLAIYPITPAAK